MGDIDPLLHHFWPRLSRSNSRWQSMRAYPQRSQCRIRTVAIAGKTPWPASHSPMFPVMRSPERSTRLAMASKVGTLGNASPLVGLADNAIIANPVGVDSSSTSNERQNHSSAIMLGGGTVSLLKQVRRPFGVTCNWNGDGHNVVSVHCLGEGVPSYCGSAWMVSP